MTAESRGEMYHCLSPKIGSSCAITALAAVIVIVLASVAATKARLMVPAPFRWKLAANIARHYVAPQTSCGCRSNGRARFAHCGRASRSVSFLLINQGRYALDLP